MPYAATATRLVRLWPILTVSTFVLNGMPADATAGDVQSLFEDAKTTASQLKRDVVQMESYARSNLTWRSHALQITKVKEHINKAGQIPGQLEKSRSAA